LIDTVSINLPPQKWTDFANPFPFDMYIGDILDASRKSNSQNASDSIEIYSWKNENGNYHTKQVYLAAMPNLHNMVDTIKGMKPYAIFNPGKKTITIRIPPVCAPVSSLAHNEDALAKNKKKKDQWSLRIDSWGEGIGALPSVYCGYNSALSKDVTYHIPPAFSNQRVSVYDQAKRLKWGGVVASNLSGGGCYFEILFDNSSQVSVLVRSLLGSIYNIESTQLIKWYDTERNLWIDSKDTMKVFLKPQQSKIQIVAIGSEQYFKDLGPVLFKNILALHAIYPNPFKRSFNIHYTLPYNARQVSFVVYNLKGQVLWKQEIKNLRPGPSSLRMDRQLATGIYILQMRVIQNGSVSPNVLNREVMCIN